MTSPSTDCHGSALGDGVRETTVERPAAYERFGALKRLYRGLIAAREARADRLIRQLLARFSDATLLSAGYTHEEIEEIRKRSAP